MHIILTPMRRDDILTLERKGDALMVNGVELDFSALREGDSVSRDTLACQWLASDVTRIAGEVRLTVVLPHAAIPWPAPEAARAVTHPQPLHLTEDGPVALPVFVPDGVEFDFGGNSVMSVED